MSLTVRVCYLITIFCLSLTIIFFQLAIQRYKRMVEGQSEALEKTTKSLKYQGEVINRQFYTTSHRRIRGTEGTTEDQTLHIANDGSGDSFIVTGTN